MICCRFSFFMVACMSVLLRKNIELGDSMRHGFIRIAACTPKVQMANAPANAELNNNEILRIYNEGAKVFVFHELSISGF